jgi:transcriptional regulator with XRE-family HTH domain
MGPIEHIRRRVFKVTQTEFADIAGVTQATVSRWEDGEFEPTRAAMEKIRGEALTRELEWDDRWFFSVPAASAEPASVGQ